MEAKKLASVLLEEMSALVSDEERDVRDPAWMRGYVTGVSNAVSIALELEGEGPDDRGGEPGRLEVDEVAHRDAERVGDSTLHVERGVDPP